MHRVELKEGYLPRTLLGFWMFLMHRVELKGGLFSSIQLATQVPNAPCGVESRWNRWEKEEEKLVPNAPCGVERILRLMSVC